MTFLKSSMSLMDFLKMTSDLLKLNQDEKINNLHKAASQAAVYHVYHKTTVT